MARRSGLDLRWFRSRAGTYGRAWVLRRVHPDGSRAVRVSYFHEGRDDDTGVRRLFEVESRETWSLRTLELAGVRWLRRRPSGEKLRRARP